MNESSPRRHQYTTLALICVLLANTSGAFAASAGTGQNRTAAQPQHRTTMAPASASNAAISPNAVPSLPPAEEATTLRYPLYGNAVRGVSENVPKAGIPTSVSLHDAIMIAVALSPTLASARADVGIARAEVRLATTGLLPSLSATVSSRHTKTSNQGANFLGTGTTTGGAATGTGTGTGTGAGTGNGTGTGGTNTGTGTGTTTGNNGTTTGSVINTFSSLNQQSNSGAITLSQLIFDGGRVAAGIHAARYSETAAADNYRRALQTLSYNVATAYYNALAAERTTQVDVELVRQNQQQLNLVAAQVRAGTTARVDEITAGLPVAQAQVAVVQAQGSQVSALASFVNILGLPANTAVQPQDDGQVLTSAGADVPIPATFDAAVARAEKMRPDLSASELNIRAARESLRQARLGLFPRLLGSATQSYNSTSLGGGHYVPATQYAATLSIPIFDNGTTSANSAEAVGELQKAEAAYKLAELGVSLDVRQSLAQLVSARAALVVSTVALNQASTILRATQAQYAAGVTTLPQLFNAQVGISQALTSQVNAAYSLRQAEQAYLYAVGEDTVQ